MLFLVFAENLFFNISNCNSFQETLIYEIILLSIEPLKNT